MRLSIQNNGFISNMTIFSHAMFFDLGGRGAHDPVTLPKFVYATTELLPSSRIDSPTAKPDNQFK
jgi:hypothetical protein